MAVSFSNDCSLPILCALEKCSLFVVAETALAQVFVGKVGNLASARGALDKSLLYEVWLVHLLNGAGILAERCGYCANANRPSLELVNDGAENLVSLNIMQKVLKHKHSLAPLQRKLFQILLLVSQLSKHLGMQLLLENIKLH